jgi:hypothetical protein
MLWYLTKCDYAECRILFIIMLGVVMLSVIMLNVVLSKRLTERANIGKNNETVVVVFLGLSSSEKVRFC